MAEPLIKRRALIEKHVLPTLADPIRYSPILEGSLPNLIHSVRDQGLEGLGAIPKPRTSEALADIVETIERFWIAVAQLPKVARGGRHSSRNNGRLIPEDT